MITQVVPLAEGFPAAARADWLALVAKTLKGAGIDTLTTRTADGLEIKPLYDAEDRATALPFVPAPRGGERSWDVRARIDAADPTLANREALDALAGGGGSILVRIATGAGGGVAVAGSQDLARVLHGVEAELAPIALDAGFAGATAAAWLDDVAKASPGAQLAFHIDPLSAFAGAGASPGPIDTHISGAAALAARLADTYPRASLFLASGGVVHEAGGSPAWELGFAAAAVVAYAKAQVAAGLSMTEAFARLTLGLHIDAEPLAAIAKLRAARVVWTRIASACGAEAPARIEARSSGRMLTRADRWTNLIRLTSAGFAAAVGGADAIVLGAFTDALGEPGGSDPADAFALRMARNTQLVLMEEAQLGRVADPAGGSWALEAQTADLAHAAWQAFQSIEAAGGLATALKSGLVADAVARSREALKGAIGDRKQRIIGVTDFVPAEEAIQTPAAPATTNGLADGRLPGPDDACPPLPPIRLEEMAP